MANSTIVDITIETEPMEKYDIIQNTVWVIEQKTKRKQRWLLKFFIYYNKTHFSRLKNQNK